MAAALLIMVIFRRIDMLSVAAVCLIIYNIYAATGYVWIASHEQSGANYYSGYIDNRVYAIILLQVLAMTLVIIYTDKKNRIQTETIAEINTILTV